MENKQNFLLYAGIGCILTGIMVLLHINNLLPKSFLTEYVNLLLAVIFAVMYLKTKNKVTIMLAVLLFSNAAMMIAGKLLMTSSWGARLFFIPGTMLLTAYIFKPKSAILTVGAILTSWGISFIFKGVNCSKSLYPSNLKY